MADKAHHEHGAPQRALAVALGLTLAFAAGEAVLGRISGSLALFADAGHMLVDTAGLGLALAAAMISRRPSDARRSYGYVRAEVLAIPVHVTLMLGIAAFIMFEAVGRIGQDTEIDGLPVLAAGAAGLAINLFVIRLLHPHAGRNLNARAARLEVAADALGSVGVIATALVILVTGWTAVDIVVSLCIAALVVPRALGLLRTALSILFESTPQGLDVAALVRESEAVAGVIALHDVHVWALAPSFVALSAHVEVAAMDGCERPLTAISQLLRERYAIEHVTLQPETRALHDALACCQFPDGIPVAGHLHA